MRRKAVLIGVWLGLPLLLWASPGLFGLIAPAQGVGGWLHDVGLAWLMLGASGLVLRGLQLAVLRGPSWGLAWVTKILTDSLHNVDLYWRSPLALLRGQRYDPIEGSH